MTDTRDDSWLKETKGKVAEKVGQGWHETKWTGFVDKLATLLRNKDNDDDDDYVIVALAELIKYGVKTDQDLRNISPFGARNDFRDELKGLGILPAICNKLFIEAYPPATPRLPPPSPPKSAVSQCEEILNKYWDKQVPSLKKFEPPQEALFHCLLKKEANIPCIPQKQNIRPSLLLYNLENVDKNSKIYQHIDSSISHGPTAIYGTSGAGKTRGCFEYLSNNYGFYFVVETQRNPGSLDMLGLLNVLPSRLVPLPPRASEDDNIETSPRIATSKSNMEIVSDHLKILITVRRTVFHCLQKRLGERRLSCHEWLLIQLYPDIFLGTDIFRDLSTRWFNTGLPEDVPLENILKMACFVDEAQILKEELPGFFLSKDGKHERSAYKAFVQGFTTLTPTESFLMYPVFSGTGLALDALQTETASVGAKPRTYPLIFFKLEPLKPEAVTSYLSEFLNLADIGGDLVEHVAKWLRGRPRWVATFLETFLIEKAKSEQTYTKPSGNFNPTEAPIIEAIDRYVDRITKKEDADRLLSWSLEGASAYSMVKGLYLRKAEFDTQPMLLYQVKDAAFKYALSGKAMVLRDETAKTIECGVASVVTTISDEDTGTMYVDCEIDEPLIVQACINFFDTQKLLEVEMATACGAAEEGIGFEHFLLPAIQRNFLKVMKEQLTQDIGDYEEYSVPSVSSYGVLACDCSGDVDKTLQWLRDSINARFEGTVPPFCFPDTSIGPDMMFFLRTLLYKMRLAVVQGKFKYKVNQIGATRTIDPKLFYRELRKLGANASTASAVQPNQLKVWSKIEEDLFAMVDEPAAQNNKPATRSEPKTKAVKRKRTEEVVRMMVQFPAERTAEANPGLVSFDSSQGTCVQGCKKCSKHDAFLIVDGSNAETLFGKQTTALLTHVKRRIEEANAQK